jgi:hypothetical protein
MSLGHGQLVQRPCGKGLLRGPQWLEQSRQTGRRTGKSDTGGGGVTWGHEQKGTQRAAWQKEMGLHAMHSGQVLGEEGCISDSRGKTGVPHLPCDRVRMVPSPGSQYRKSMPNPTLPRLPKPSYCLSHSASLPKPYLSPSVRPAQPQVGCAMRTTAVTVRLAARTPRPHLRLL